MPIFVPPTPHLDRSTDRFAELRAVFADAGISEQYVTARLGIARLSAIDAALVRQQDTGPLRNACDALIRVFVEGHPISRSDFETLVGRASTALLEDFRLLIPHADSQLAATVSLYPIRSLFIASDRYNNADGSPYEGWDDLVYPCLFSTTEKFLELIPTTAPGADVLDVCSGTGVAGLLLASSARSVVCADLTARCSHFARFNALLNGFDNVETATGDLFQPVAGRRFDYVLAHPPYQPVVEHSSVFNSGGEDGEAISRRVFAEAFPSLKPGGRLYCHCQLTDREHPAEVRVHALLDEADSENADVAFFCLRRQDFAPYAAVETLRTGRTYSVWRRWTDGMHRLGVEKMVYGMFVVQRHVERREGFTLRHEVPGATSEIVASTMATETLCAQPDFADRISRVRLRARPGSALEVTHVPNPQGGWMQDSLRLRRNEPLPASVEVDGVTAGVLASADGTRTGAELRAAMPMEVPDEYFVGMMRLLVSRGFLSVLE